MNLKTSAEYRAALFGQLEERGVTHDVIARLWKVLEHAPDMSHRLYNALNNWAFSQPSELLACGNPAAVIERAHEQALAMISISVETICEIAATLEAREAEVEAERLRVDAILQREAEAQGDATPDRRPRTGAPSPRPSASVDDNRKRVAIEDQGVGNDAEIPERLHG
jgi:hypothetical protein